MAAGGINKPGTLDGLIEHILINYRWVFVIFFLMPISVLYDAAMYVRSYVIFKLNSAPEMHDIKVQDVQKQVGEIIIMEHYNILLGKIIKCIIYSCELTYNWANL